MVSAGHRQIADDELIDSILDLVHFFGGDRLIVAKVEACFLIVHERTFLIDVCSQHPSQRVIEEVGRGMIAHDVDPGEVDCMTLTLSPTESFPCSSVPICTTASPIRWASSTAKSGRPWIVASHYRRPGPLVRHRSKSDPVATRLARLVRAFPPG